jgi:hypothetical protein
MPDTPYMPLELPCCLSSRDKSLPQYNPRLEAGVQPNDTQFLCVVASHLCYSFLRGIPLQPHRHPVRDKSLPQFVEALTGSPQPTGLPRPEAGVSTPPLSADLVASVRDKSLSQYLKALTGSPQPAGLPRPGAGVSTPPMPRRPRPTPSGRE